MSWKIVIMLAVYAIGISCGQILFKVSAIRANKSTNGFSILNLVSDPYFIAAIALYGSLTVFWVWILTRMSLGLAYPFVALSFVFTPAATFLLFDERIDGWYVFALFLILSGLTILLWKTPS